MPGQTLRWLAADDLIEWIVFVLGHGDPNLHGPMIIRDVRCHFCLRLPIKLPTRAAIQIDDRACRIDGDLIVAVFVRIQFDLDRITIKQSLIIVLGSRDIQLFAGSFFTSDAEIEVLAAAIPSWGVRPLGNSDLFLRPRE